MLIYKKLIFFIIILLFIIIGSFNYFKYNDVITYFATDISNSGYLVNLIDEKGFVKNPSLNFNNSSCKVLNFNDISNNCNNFITKFYNNDFLDKIKNIINEEKLFFIDPIIDPLAFVIQLYKENDFMSYHFDTNFSLGKRYTVIIPLYLNEFNTSYLTIKDKSKNEKKIIIPIGKAIVYNGDNVLHKVSKQEIGGERISLIINLTTNSNYSLFGKYLQKVRNYMYINYTW